MISLSNPNGIRYPICRTSDCGMSESPREVWARVQGMLPPCIIHVARFSDDIDAVSPPAVIGVIG
jgi:hypothetical protein